MIFKHQNSASNRVFQILLLVFALGSLKDVYAAPPTVNPGPWSITVTRGDSTAFALATRVDLWTVFPTPMATATRVVLTRIPVSYTHLTLPTNREV